MAKSDDRRIHPYIPKLVEQLEQRRVGRREFLRTSTLLGLSATTAYGIVGRVFGESAIPRARAQGTPGGILRVAMQVQKMEDPATYSWIADVQPVPAHHRIPGDDRPRQRHPADAGRELGRVRRPQDLDLQPAPGREWHNGEDFIADHVVWNVERWRDPALGSSNIGLSTFASHRDSVEAVDAHTVRFNLTKPVLSVPEDCYNYPTAILHRSFKPPFSDNPIGTGPSRSASSRSAAAAS